MSRPGAEPAMSADEWSLVRAFIREQSGIDFPIDSKFLVERRLVPRLEALRMTSFHDYYLHLRYGSPREAELDELLDRVTTNETYFFRESYQLEAFSREILPEIHAHPRRTRRLHVWSAGCSTGEEAYTIAMLIHGTGMFRDWDVQIFGSDISRRVIAAGRKGVYGKSAFRTTDDNYARAWFRFADGKYHIAEELKRLVTFGQMNLLDEGAVGRLGEMDVVFCRNVLIYLDHEARRRVIDHFHRKLGRRGYLLLGHTESLVNLSTAFELVHLERDMVYRKP